MHKIQTNESGTRYICVSDEHLETIDRYQLLRDLIDSNGYVDESVQTGVAPVPPENTLDALAMLTAGHKAMKDMDQWIEV